jgi:hypothetical protein
MQKTLLLCAIFLTASWALNANRNREPYSPAGDYKFSLKDIQDTVRKAVKKADEEIQLLSEMEELNKIAHLYFRGYLEKIGSYNEIEPQIVNIEEAYKTELVNAFVLKEFKETFPDLIYDQSKWMFNSVGGIYANMIILYCSPKEYIVLWGTTLRSDNKFSGYYPFMNEFDVMVRGQMQSHDLAATGHAAVIYRPVIQDGIVAHTVDTSNLVPENVRSYNLAAYTYMVSYAQGNILRAFFPGAIMPAIFVNQDWAGLYSHIKESVKAYIGINKKHRDHGHCDWTINPNYRAIWIIDDYQEAQRKRQILSAKIESAG